MKEPYRLLYVGNDIHTLFLLEADPDLSVVGVNFNPIFLNYPAQSPFDHLFKLLYRLRSRERLPALESAVAGMYRHTRRLSASLHGKYADYLLLLSRRRLPLVNLDRLEEAKRFMSDNKVDLMVVNYWYMLDKELISAPRLGALNVHPSRLPQYRGALPTLWALKNGDKASAVSYMILKPGMDNGDVLAQHEFTITPQDDALSLERKIEEVLTSTLLPDIKRYLSGESRPQPQDSAKHSKTGRFYEYMAINWEQEQARDIVDKINYYHQWPLDACHARLDGEQVFFHSARLAERDLLGQHARAGDFQVQGRNLHIKAVSGTVLVDLPLGMRLRDGLRLLARRRGRLNPGSP